MAIQTVKKSGCQPTSAASGLRLDLQAHPFTIFVDGQLVGHFSSEAAAASAIRSAGGTEHNAQLIERRTAQPDRAWTVEDLQHLLLMYDLGRLTASQRSPKFAWIR